LALARRHAEDNSPVDRSPFARGAYEGFDLGPGSSGAPTLLDFRLHALSGEDKLFLQIVGVSTVITCLLMAIAFGLTTVLVKVMQLFG
jgi:hypothetical protein